MSRSSPEWRRHNTLSLTTQRCLRRAVITTSDVTETANGERGTGNAKPGTSVKFLEKLRWHWTQSTYVFKLCQKLRFIMLIKR